MCILPSSCPQETNLVNVLNGESGLISGMLSLMQTLLKLFAMYGIIFIHTTKRKVHDE
jgi:hypothetical protein